MTKVSIAPAGALAPTKDYADACWRENPRISPDSWRENHGQTSSRIWLDGLVDGWQEAHAAGCNGLLVRGPVPELPERDSWVVACVIDDVQALPDGADYLVIDPARHGVAETAPLLERAVMEGRAVGWGVILSRPVDMGAVWQHALAGAAEAWGRRRKPSLKFVAAPFGLGRTALLDKAVCDFNGEAVAVLEWCARRDVMCLALEGAVCATPVGEAVAEDALPEEVVAVLANRVGGVAAAEQRLMAALDGWPQRGGEPVFSVLMHLQHGVPLWPGMASWQAWERLVWPELQAVWQSVAAQRPALAGDVGDYLRLLGALLPEKDSLAQLGAARWRDRIDGWLTESLPALANMPAPVRRAVVVSSVPGVSAVAGRWTAHDTRAAMEAASVVDVAPYF